LLSNKRLKLTPPGFSGSLLVVNVSWSAAQLSRIPLGSPDSEVLAWDSIPPSRFRIRWQYRGLAAFVGLGCLVIAGFATFALMTGTVPENSSVLQHSVIVVVTVLASFAFVRLAWTGSGVFLARFFDAETLRIDARREEQEREQLWRRAASDLSAAEELQKRLSVDLATDAEIQRKETRPEQLHLLARREQDTRKQLLDIERMIGRLRGI
jgi:hypothetical protein